MVRKLSEIFDLDWKGPDVMNVVVHSRRWGGSIRRGTKISISSITSGHQRNVAIMRRCSCRRSGDRKLFVVQESLSGVFVLRDLSEALQVSASSPQRIE